MSKLLTAWRIDAYDAGSMGKADSNSARRAEQKERLLRGWLTERGYQVQVTTDFQPKARWCLLAIVDGEIPISFFQQEDRTEEIEIQGMLELSTQQQNRVSQLPNEKRNALFRALHLELLRVGTEFGGIKNPLERITVSQSIFYDGLTRDNFFQRLLAVKRGMHSVRTVLSASLAGSDGEPEFTVN